MTFQNPESNKDKAPLEIQHKTWNETQGALADIRKTFGFVPSFISTMPELSVPGAWAEIKNVYYNPNTALDFKTKSLIGLAIASQIPCPEISYLNAQTSIVFGATPTELQETLMMAALSRHWSTLLNGTLLDKELFKKEVNQVMVYVARKMEDSGGDLLGEEAFLFRPVTAEETYKDIQQTFGLVPQFFLAFPQEGIGGAWSEFKAVQLNPYTALSGKQKELIGLAVAAQIPCEYCIHFHRNGARLNGATERELQEAIAGAALTRHWSTIFHGPQMNFELFKQDADRMIYNLKQHRTRPLLHS